MLIKAIYTKFVDPLTLEVKLLEKPQTHIFSVLSDLVLSGK